MQSTTAATTGSRTAIWLGRIISTLLVLMLTMSAVMKFVKPAQLVKEFQRMGYSDDIALGLGMLELTCALIYAIPRTSVLGAILLTGYLGGAIATHVRIYDAFFTQFILGVLAWLGLYLRDPRLRAILPLRSDPSEAGSPVARGVPWLRTIAYSLAGIILILVIVVALQPGQFSVVRSTEISAPPAEVFSQVNDFHNWQEWSPWKKLDPEAKNTYEGPSSGTGAGFKWSGNDKIGEGRMTITESRPNALIRIKLEFIRPFPSVADVDFSFKPEGKQTVATWAMSGHNTFVSKAFCLFMNMDKMIGGDFEEGLRKMKAVSEGTSKK